MFTEKETKDAKAVSRRVNNYHSEQCTHLKDLEAGEHVILDIHSHGTHPAFFSSEDNFDDSKYRGNLKNCYVLGNLDQPQLSYTHRWVSRGHIFAQQGQAKVAENPGAPAC